MNNAVFQLVLEIIKELGSKEVSTLSLFERKILSYSYIIKQAEEMREWNL